MVARDGIDWRPGFLDIYPGTPSWILKERSNLSGHFPDLSMRTLLLWGEEDPISPLAVGEYLMKRIPNGGMRILRHGTHSVAVEQLDTVASATLEHLESSISSGSP